MLNTTLKLPFRMFNHEYLSSVFVVRRLSTNIRSNRDNRELIFADMSVSLKFLCLIKNYVFFNSLSLGNKYVTFFLCLYLNF